MSWQTVLKQLDDHRFLIPKGYKDGMRTEGLIYSDAKMIQHIYSEKAHEQVANVACLPGIVGRSLAMPDIHLGYGFTIGGVAAFSAWRIWCVLKGEDGCGCGGSCSALKSVAGVSNSRSGSGKSRNDSCS